MKTYNRALIGVMALIILLFLGANVWLLTVRDKEGGRPYRVEVNRIALQIEDMGLEGIDLSQCKYVTNVESYGEAFYDSHSDYVIREIEGQLYRFDYIAEGWSENDKITILVNVMLGIMSGLMMLVLLLIRRKILLPFEELVEVPYELAKGNLTVPLKESRSRLLGRFVWGMDLLRENMEQQKQRELELQRDKRTLLLSLSHDIKTPLSAIKLYAKALSKGLYTEKDIQLEIAECINGKADEIEHYVSEIISTSKEEIISLNVQIGEFYLSELVKGIEAYYREKLALNRTEFLVEKYTDCLLNGDLDRSVEILQNVMENAIKYGDGRWIEIGFSEEEGCLLISVKNSGGSLSETELPHIFESFWRGANSERISGSGLGLYICRQLIHKMGGEIFANVRDDLMMVVIVWEKA